MEIHTVSALEWMSIQTRTPSMADPSMNRGDPSLAPPPSLDQSIELWTEDSTVAEFAIGSVVVAVDEVTEGSLTSGSLSFRLALFIFLGWWSDSNVV